MDDTNNGPNSRERSHFFSQREVSIVEEQLADGAPISDISATFAVPTGSAGIVLALLLMPLLSADAVGQQRGGSVPEIPLARGAEAERGDAVSPGFVGVKDGHLWRDGQRLRLWGVNCVNEYDPNRTYAEQDMLLDRIKACGFNAIRLHLYDIWIVPEGDSGTMVPTYVKGDGSKMDHLDHFIAGAAERGLILYMTLDRRLQAILPSAYDLVKTGGDADEVAWKKAVEEANAANPHAAAWVEQVWPLDRRLEEVYSIYVRNLLAHENLYTGYTYAEDPAIGLWEISNESCFLPVLMGGDSAALKGHFGEQTRKRWNEFLAGYYKSADRLQQAWGSLEEGESLKEGTIKLSPVPVPIYEKPAVEQAIGPSRRIRDLTTFFINSCIEGNDRILKLIRASAPAGVGAAVVPVGYDTHYQPNLIDMYCAAAGNVSIAGNYTWLRTYDTSDPTYPFTSMLAAPPTYYGMDLGRIAGKPSISYEVNIHKPFPWRAEFPLILAAYYSARDWDGAFWYYWSPSHHKPPVDYQDLHSRGISYSTTSDPWGGVQTYDDEVLVSSIRLAGEIFRSGALRADETPAKIVAGADDLIESPAKMSSWMDLVRTNMRTRGAVIDFSSAGTNHQALDATPRATPKSSRLGPDVTFDHTHRQMIGISDRARIFVGWPDKSEVMLSDGVVLRDLKPGQFAAFAMVSQDDLPISQSHKILMTALATGENAGFQYDPKATTEIGWPGMLKSIISLGGAPAQIVWPTLSVVLTGRSGKVTWFNAFPSQIEVEEFSEQIRFDGIRAAAWEVVEVN